MVRKSNKKSAQKCGEVNKNHHPNTKVPQPTRPHIQVRSTMHHMDTCTPAVENDVEPDGRPSKRLKPTTTDASDHVISQSARADLPETAPASVVERSSLSRTTQLLPPELEQLRSRYELTTMSITSSSKIEKSVRTLLLSLDKFSFADLESKPGVVMLSSKAGAAAKMVSIVEIAKGAIERDRGKWYQYSKLHGEIVPLKQKAARQTDGGKTLSKWQTEQKRPREESPEGSTMQVVEETKLLGHDDDGDEDAFETMGFAGLREPNTTTQEHEARAKVRAVPVMTIYMSRVAVPGLKDIFGEQTNT